MWQSFYEKYSSTCEHVLHEWNVYADNSSSWCGYIKRILA